MIAKWICVPYGILVIVLSCYTKCVIPDYLSSYSMWYSSYEYYSILEYALIFGVFGGIITGLIVDILNHRASLIIASILALISYCLIPQFDGSTREKHQDWHYYILLLLMFLAGQSSSLAIIAAVKINLKNFNATVAPLIICILLSYFYIGIHIESSIRWSFLFGIDTKVYLLGVGITSFVIYAIGAFILTFDQGAQQHSIESQYYLAMLDKIGCSIFIMYEVFLVLLLMLFKLIMKNVYVSSWICIVLMIGNFIIPIINAECVLSRANNLLLGYSPDPNELRKVLKVKDKSLFGSFESLRLFGLLIVSLILIGSGSQVFERLSKISISISMGYLTEYTMIWYIFGNFITRIFAGAIYMISNNVNEYLLMLIFSLEILLSTILIYFVPSQSVVLFNLACFIAGSGVGGLSIMIPVIIVQDYGRKNFGFIWGTFCLFMQAGVFLFSSIIFDYFYGNYHDNKWDQKCSMQGCYSNAILISSVLSIAAVAILFFVWYMDSEDVKEGQQERVRIEENKTIGE